jgi:AAA domain, putative AbiEii toxin, Type IV TA system
VRLVRAKVENYRSIEDSGWVEIESDLTALVGKNESGKTAFLQALFRLNPVEPADYDEVVDFPSRQTRQRKDVEGPIPVCTAEFELTEIELADIEADLGQGALTAPTFQIWRGYRSTRLTYPDLKINEDAVVHHLTSGLDLPEQGGAEVRAAGTVRDLVEALTALSEPTAKASELLARISGWREQRVALHLMDQYLSPRLPKFVYFDEYSTMPGRVSIPSLIQERDGGVLDRGKRALLALLSLVRGRPEDFSVEDRHERLIRELENTANSISDEVFEYWSQNTDLQVELKVLPPEPGAQPPLDQGPIFHVRVYNRRHRVSVSFDERSRGFVWFFSFLAYFSELEERRTSDLILLLDEPGLALHATAQRDLLRYMEEKLAPRHQVLYTTHSPFMIDPAHLERARTVVDLDDDGTKISAEVFRVDEETVFPLQAALGYTLAQTLFLGPKNALLEGPSDLIYLEVMNGILADAGKSTIDDSWVLVPVGGAGKLSTFVALIGSNQLKLAVLVDASTKDADAVKRLSEAGRLEKGSLIMMSEITGTTDADIEDLFDPTFYLELVNRAYSGPLAGRPITLADLPAGDRITRRVNAVFAQRGIDEGKLNHFRAARVLLRHQDELEPMIDDATKDRFEQLAQRINSVG